MNSTFFSETQRFNQWWMKFLIIGLLAIPIISIYQQIILGKPFGNKPVSDGGLLIISSLILFVCTLLWFMKLSTQIDSKAVKFRFFPFIKRNVSWQDIDSAEVINYGFVGGWGIRFSFNYGMVYNTKGQKGLFIKLKNGKKLILGTQRHDELHTFITNLKKE